MAIDPNNPLTWETFKPESEAPKTEPVDPKNPLTWEAYKPSIFPEKAIPNAEEPGYVGALARGLGAGFRRRLPEMIGQAIEMGSAPLLAEGAVSPAHKITEWAQKGEVRPEFKNPVKEALYSGGEMLAPSLVPPLAMGAAGLGAIPAAIAGGALFGLSQAQQTRESAQERIKALREQRDQLARENAPADQIGTLDEQIKNIEKNTLPAALGTGGIEAAGETLGTIALTRLFGPLAPLFKKGVKVTAGEITRPTLRRLLREFPKTLGVEAGTEVGQQWGEAEVERQAGIRPEAIPWKEGLGAIAPTAVLTGLTMGMALPGERLRAPRLEKALTQPTTKENFQERLQAVQEIGDKIQEADQRIGQKWKTKALDAVINRKSIPLDEDIMEWVGEPHLTKEEAKKAAKEVAKQTAAIPPQPEAAETPKQPTQAIPMPEPAKEPPKEGQPFDLVKNAPAEPTRDDWKAVVDQLSETVKGKPKTGPKGTIFSPEQVGRAMGKGALNLITGEEETETPAAATLALAEKPARAPEERVVQPGPEGLQSAIPIPGAGAHEEIKAAGTARPTPPTTAIKVEEAAKEAATHPQSVIPEPTEAQKEAGNYQKGHVSLHGLDISIENPRGSTRSGVSPEGKPWTTTMAHHYGYIRGTKGRDKDHLDVFIGPNPESLKTFVVDQVDPKTGKFDEHKIMLGFNTLDEARQGYLSNYEPGWKGLGDITEGDIDQFKEWIKGDTSKPVSAKLQTPKQAIATEKPNEPVRAERNGKEVKPGVTLRNVAEDLMSGDQGREEVALAMLVNSVRSGKVSREDALNVRNEIQNIAWEEWRKAGGVEEDFLKYQARVEAAGKRIAATAPEMIEPGSKPETKAAITEKRPLAEIFADFKSGRISPTEAVAESGFPDLATFNKEFEKSGKEEIKAAGTGRPTQGAIKENEPEPKKEIRPTPIEITGAAAIYANGLKNKFKKTYAWGYIKWRIGQREAEPEGKGLSAVAKETIRKSVDKALEGGKESKPEGKTSVPAKEQQAKPEEPKEVKAAGTGRLTATKEEKTKPPAVPEASGNHWLKNPDTGKIELYFSKAQFDAMDPKLKQRVKVRFLWAPSKKAWVSKATKDMFWPETIVRDLTAAGIFKKEETKAEEPVTKAAEPETKAPAGETTAEKADIEAEAAKLTEEDLDAMLDEAFENKPKAAPAEKTPKLTTAPMGEIAPPTKSLTQILKSVGDLGVKGADEALKGLHELFGGGALKSFPGAFNEETYVKAKPHFDAAFQAFKDAGKGLKEFFSEMRKQFGAAIRPYLRHFMQEKMAPAEASAEEGEITQAGTAGGRGPRRKLTDQEKADKEAKAKAAEEKKAKKADMGEFKNVGYVYDPEHLNKKIKDKSPSGAAKVILDEMTPAKVWDMDFAEGTSQGVVRMKDQVQKMFRSFREFLLFGSPSLNYFGGRRLGIDQKIARWTKNGGNVEQLKTWAKEYGEMIQPFIQAFEGQTSITNVIGRLQQAAYPGAGTADTWPERHTQMSQDSKHRLFSYDNVNAYLTGGSEKFFFDFLKKGWQSLIENENEILLNEININKRGRNKTIVRSGLPDYRQGVELKKTEDFQAPFGFKGVGFGEEGWINQEERNRVIPAAYDAFKDLAATLKAPDVGMSLGKDLAVQFANLGHKAKGAAAAYFPTVQTINFTRDNGDGTMAHEWGHGLHDLAALDAKTEINAIIRTFYHVFDFEAGDRLASDLLAKDSQFLKRIISSKKQERITAVKEKIKEEYRDTVKKETHYFEVARQMDADYTARAQEMWARAFESYVYDTLPGRNNYLVTDFVAAGRVGGKSGVGTSLVYPAGKEREDFNATIQHFIDGLAWDENGKPSLKADYETIDKHNEALLKAKLDELLVTVEERYKAIWTSEPSKDGRFWYRYDVTEFAPMMQPDGYVAYDKEYKGTEEGTGAVAYLTQLHPDHILDFKLSNIKYEGDHPTVIAKEGGEKNVGDLQASGEATLGEVPARHGEGAEGEGGVRAGVGPGSGAGVGGAHNPPARGGATRSSEGGGTEGVHPSSPGNYRITDDTLNDPKSIDARFIANLGAIRTLKDLEASGRPVTQRDKETLAKYSGWGGMAEAFAWDPSPAWRERAELIKAELDQDELNGAAQSSPSAYYTPVPVASFMWKLAQRLGFKGGLVLEPSMGANGTFFGTLPEDLAQSTALQGIEKDPVSARIAARLYEKAQVENKSFQDANKPNNRTDLTIGNVPFQNLTVTDTKHNKGRYGLANYFINKMLNLSAPGTLTLVITGTGTMDSEGGHLKEYAEKADLVGAIRLPGGIYAASNTNSDILVFRKKIEGSKFKGIPAEEWTGTGKHAATDVTINKYFIAHPDMIAGKLEKVIGRYGDDASRVAPEGDLQKNLERMAAAFPENIVEREAVRRPKTLDEIIAAPGTVKEGGFYLNSKGQASWKQGGEEIVFPTSTPAEKRKAEVVKGFVGILDQVRQVLRIQRTTTDKEQIKAEQESLKNKYEAFVKKHGPINRRENLNVYNDATDSPWVIALEDYDSGKDKVKKLADIFTKEITVSGEKPDHAETDHDALAMSLDEFGYPNLEYMARLRKSDPETVLAGVLDRVVENPETGFMETMDEYLSGNVRRKLDVARQMAEGNPQYERNVKLLEAAQPPEIPAHRITARIGASWIDPNHLAAYVTDKIGLTGLYPVFNFNPISNEWTMSFSGRPGRWKGGVRVENAAQTDRDLRAAQKSVEATRVWGTQYRNFFELIKDAIEGRRPLVTYYDNIANKTVIDPVATKGAEAKLQDIQRDFQTWLFADATRGEEAVARFNLKINTSVPMIPDGSHLTFPGKSLALLTAKEAKEIGVEKNPVVLYPHQANVVWKYLRTGNLYLAHEMGAGKTISMAMIGMEARRLRGKKKVLYVTHSDSTMDQGIAEIKKLYPLANVLPVRVSTNEQRKQHALQKIALNDFDIAVMRQQDLDRIALSPDAERTFIQEDLAELREVLEYAKKSGENIQERDIQSRITALEEKLKKTVHEEAKRQNLFFDDLGIDLLITDEVHSYKNVPFATRLHGITGLNPAGSPTAQSFLRKTQYLNAAFPKRDAVVVGSGTPLTNSIAELYNLQKFLQPQEMKRQGVWNFDRWIANYGEIGTELEWDGARQEHKAVTTNRRIVNAGRLLATVFQNLDSVQADDTPIKRPKIRGGEPQRVKIKPNQYVEEYKEIVRQRARNIENDARHAEFEGVPDNMLRIISNMSKVAIDQRLDSRYTNTPMQEDSKIYQSSRIIARRWKEEAQHKGVQLVFADLGVPHRFAGKFKYKTDEQLEKLLPEEVKEYNDAKFEHENQTTGFNTYDALKSELIKLGIPAREIAFIHDADAADKDKKKANLRALFDKVNEGEIRVLIGSTSKAGTGVNVQKRISDIHHLDVWWNYSSWAQRNGRGRRAGNIYTDLDGIYIWNYVTETTVDATRWDKVYAKGKVLNSVLSGDINLDVIEDISEETMSAKMMAAEASGDPLMAQHAQVMNRVQNLRMEQSSYLDNVRTSKMELSRVPGQIAANQKAIEEAKKSQEVMEKVTAVQFAGDPRTLVLDKHGKEIAAALEEAVTKAVKSDLTGRESTNLFVLGSHEETEVKELVEGKEKKVKKYTFTPLPVKGSMPPASEYRPQDRKLTLSGSIMASERDLAAVTFSFPKKNKGEETRTFAYLKMDANVSRTVTEYISRRKGDQEYYAKEIDDLKAKEPKLRKVAETPWDKQTEFEDKVKQLADIERQMAERGQTAGKPEEGIPIAQWEAPIPSLEDIAEKDRWRTYPYKTGEQDIRQVYWPMTNGRDIPFAFFKEGTDLKDYARNRGGKFSAEQVSTYSLPDALELLKGKPLADTPKVTMMGYTTIDNETKFWARAGKGMVSVNPTHWQMIERIVGNEGSWHYDDSRMEGTFLVHVNTQGQRDAFIRVRREVKSDWPKNFKEEESPKIAPEGGEVSFAAPEGWARVEGEAQPEWEEPHELLSDLSALVRKIAGAKPIFMDTIPVDLRDEAVQEGLKKHGYTDEKLRRMIDQGYTAHTVGGSMTPVLTSQGQWKAMIRVSLSSKNPEFITHVAFHEAFEAARRLMLTEKEIAILDAKLPGRKDKAASEVQSDAFAHYMMGKKTAVIPRSAQTLFDKIKNFFERLGNYLNGLGFHTAADIFENLAQGEVRERFRAGELGGLIGHRPAAMALEGTAFKLNPETKKNLDALHSEDIAQKAAEEPGFKDFVKKIRFGLVKITDPDLKLWERILSLPYWLQDKYREFRPLLRTQMHREEARSELVHGLLKRGNDFFVLKGEQLKNVEQAITQGDREGKVYKDPQLEKRFKLDEAGINAYRSVRQTLDWIHRKWWEKIEANFLREFERERWFSLFKAAHGFDLSDDETNALAQALRKTYRAQEMPLNTVRKHLQKIFNEKLSQDDKRLLVKNYVEAWHKAKAALMEIKNIVRDAIGEGMGEEELNNNVKALVQTYVRSEPQATMLKEMRDELNRIGGYFPRSRKAGKYRVVVTEMMEDPLGNQVPVTLYYENAANRIEATRIYNKVSADPQYKDLKITVEPVRQEAESSFVGASAISMQRLVDNAIEKLRTQGAVDFDTASQMRMNILETLAEDLKGRGAGRYSIRRAEHIIEGYQKTNLKEVLRDYIEGWAGMMTKQDAALEFLDELKDIPRSKPQLMAYSSKYAQDMLRNQEAMDRISQKFRGGAFIYFLGGSLRSALVNFTQNYVTGIPFLAREVGWKSLKAEKFYHKAMFDAATGKNISPAERRMLDEMINKGIAEDQYIQQITRETKGAMSARVADVTKILATPFSWIERLNRSSAALAMFRVAHEKAINAGRSAEEAYKTAFTKAEDFVYKTHYLMSKANLPSLAAGGDVGSQFAKTAYTFRRFTHNYLLSLQNTFRGPDGKLALDVMGRSLAYLAILGGVPALPFLDDLLDLWEKFFGTPLRSSMRKTMREIGGPIMEKMGMAGIPAMIGIDISGSLKTQLPFVGVTPADTIYGVYGGVLQKWGNAKDAAERDDILRAVEFASPSFIESVLKAYRMAEQGATTPKGKVLTDEQGKPIRLQAPEAVSQGAGFRPERISAISGEHRTMQNIQGYFTNRRDDIYAKYRLAKTEEDRRAILRDITKFNLEARKYPGVISPITMTSLKKATAPKPEKRFMAFGAFTGGVANQ